MAQDKSVAILAASWTETALGLVFLTLRFLSNRMFVGRFRWDFALAALTVATQSTAQIFLQLSVNGGMGHHFTDLTAEQQITALYWVLPFQLLAIVANMLGKLAILAFLIQIRGRHSTKPWLLIVLGVLIFAVNITVMGTILGQCMPLAKLWNDAIPGTCDPGRKLNENYSFFQGSFNVFCDAALATYPIYLFWGLQMKLHIKIAVSILMGLGWIAAVCAAFKCYELKALSETTDITYAQSPLLIWASTEAWIVVIVGCVPPIRPLMERVLQHLGLTSKKASNPYYQGRSGLGNHSQAYGDHKPRGRADENLTWVELTNARGSNDSKNGIINGNDIMVTTEFTTQFEEPVAPLSGSSRASHTSGDGGIMSTDIQKVV